MSSGGLTSLAGFACLNRLQGPLRVRDLQCERQYDFVFVHQECIEGISPVLMRHQMRVRSVYKGLA